MSQDGLICDHEHAQPPDPMSEPSLQFFRQHHRLTHFMGYLTNVAMRMDDQAKSLASLLVQVATTEDQQHRWRRIAEHGAGATAALGSNVPLLLEMMLTRTVDNYLSYVSEMLALIFRTRPETLRSGETVRLDMVLQHATMDDLIADLTDRKVNQLSYQGMRDLSQYLSERLRFDLYITDDDMSRSIRIIEDRNIIVHNRGIVNRVYLSRIQRDDAPILGSTLILDPANVHSDMEFLACSVIRIDERASQKFDLPRPVDRESSRKAFVSDIRAALTRHDRDDLEQLVSATSLEIQRELKQENAVSEDPA